VDKGEQLLQLRTCSYFPRRDFPIIHSLTSSLSADFQPVIQILAGHSHVEEEEEFLMAIKEESLQRTE
jgi:hypothetical protein